jgi:predicted lysophospholipase L1 biosynthesis ABC-type transport system permease subunit
MPAKGLGSDPRPPRVIGVVEDVRYDGLDTAAGGSVYMPWSQLPLGVVSLVLRTSGDPRQSVPAVRALLNQLDPGLAIEGVQTLDDLAGRSIAGRRLQFLAACSFALLTLAIALLGLVAALMRSVTERRHELAIRAALGGSPRDIRRLIVRKGAALTAAGLGAGVGGGLIATRLLANALFGVTPYDPLTFGVVTAGILAVAVLACLLPATHAGRVNPAEVLRS